MTLNYNNYYAFSSRYLLLQLLICSLCGVIFTSYSQQFSNNEGSTSSSRFLSSPTPGLIQTGAILQNKQLLQPQPRRFPPPNKPTAQFDLPSVQEFRRPLPQHALIRPRLISSPSPSSPLLIPIQDGRTLFPTTTPATNHFKDIVRVAKSKPVTEAENQEEEENELDEDTTTTITTRMSFKTFQQPFKQQQNQITEGNDEPDTFEYQTRPPPTPLRETQHEQARAPYNAQRKQLSARIGGQLNHLNNHQQNLKPLRDVDNDDEKSSSNRFEAPVKYERPATRTTKKPVVAQIVRKYREDKPDGSITWGFENDDGSYKEETIGNDCVTRGKYGYIDPDGVKREYNYSSGLPCKKQEDELDQESSNAIGYVDYSSNRIILPNGQHIDLNNMVKNRARKPVPSKRTSSYQ